MSFISYRALEKQFERITHLNHIEMLAHWDAATGLPKGSTTSRHQEMATLSTIIHEMCTSEEIGVLIGEVMANSNNLTDWQKANFSIIKKSYDKKTCISPDLQHEHSMAVSQSEYFWREARVNNDFSSLEPYLDKVFDLTRKIVKLKADKLGVSDLSILVDEYDPGRTHEEVEAVFIS
jgi:carboxypeptidase Taq